jgi:hypothetical protein
MAPKVQIPVHLRQILSNRLALVGVACAVMLAAMISLGQGAPQIITPPKPSGRELYVAPDGKHYHKGTKDKPYDLETIFRDPTIAQPGDVVWLRGGVYNVAVTSELTGTPEAPIVVRGYPGERVILNASSRTESALTVKGSDTWYWDLEVTDTSPARISHTPSYTTGLRTTSVTVFGSRTRFINMVVHDGEQGFGFWQHAQDSELYGNLIYNVGFSADDRGHGHSIYVQNEKGTKRIVDNILFNGHSFGIHAYTERGFLDNIEMEGNTAFNHGVLAQSGAMVNYLIRSKNEAAKNPVLVDNYGYFSEPHQGRVAELWAPLALKSCTNLLLTGNYFAAPLGVALTVTCQSVRAIRGNTFLGDVRGIDSSDYPENVYLTKRPAGLKVFVRPNRYELGRANITIFNWDMKPTVDIDVSAAGLKRGDRFELRDAQDYFGAPVVSGTYSGAALAVPMTGTAVSAPAGTVAVPPKHTSPEFGVFILRKVPPTGTPAR